MAITVFNGPAGGPAPKFTFANYIVVTTHYPAVTGGATVPTTGQIWPRGSHA